jgi:hypothetical protein
MEWLRHRALFSHLGPGPKCPRLFVSDTAHEQEIARRTAFALALSVAGLRLAGGTSHTIL